MSLSSKLKKANKAWQKLKDDDDGDFEKRPDGKYKVRIKTCKIIEPDSGNVLLVLGGDIKEGEEKGKKAEGVFLLINKKGEINEWGAKLGRRALVALGEKVPESMDEWPDACKRVLKREPLARLKLNTKENSDFQNLSVDKLLDEDGSGSASGSGSKSSGSGSGSGSASKSSGSKSESKSSESESGSASSGSGSSSTKSSS